MLHKTQTWLCVSCMALLTESEFPVKRSIKGGDCGRLESGRDKCALTFVGQGCKWEQAPLQNQREPCWNLNFGWNWCSFDALHVPHLCLSDREYDVSLTSIVATANMTWLRTFWEASGIWGLSGFVITDCQFWKRQKIETGKENINARGFLLFTCVCSNAVLKITPAACVLFSRRASWAALSLSTLRYPFFFFFPLLRDCVFAHAGYSRSQHVHQIQEASRLLCVCGWATAHPAGSVSTLRPPRAGGGSTKTIIYFFLHNLLFRPRRGVGLPKCWGPLWPRAADPGEAGAESGRPPPSPRPPARSLLLRGPAGRGLSGACRRKDAVPRAPRSPYGCTFNTFLFLHQLQCIRCIERGKKIRLQTRGRSNKRLTLSASSFKSVELLLGLIINICVVFRTLRFQTSQCLTSWRLSVRWFKARVSIYAENTRGSKNRKHPRKQCASGMTLTVLILSRTCVCNLHII